MKVTPVNPTDAVSIDFPAYRVARQRMRDQHSIGGVPDYGFGMDLELRRAITTIPMMRQIAQAIVRAHEPLMQQMNLINGIAVGPDQYPQIFHIAERCAERLGIGMPRVFILHEEITNAWTYATDDSRPSIVITTRLLRNLNEDELTAIIGHECGHVHNLHSAYNTLVELACNQGARRVLSAAAGAGAPVGLLLAALSVLSSGLRLAMLKWSRAAEITSDRAGAICAGGVMPMMSALAKLKTGGEAELGGMNLEAYLRQLDEVRRTPVKFIEVLQTHPMTQKRIAALAAFADSETCATWLPPAGGIRPSLSRQELESRCAAIVKVTGRG